jgi:hypothetical protein
MDPVPNPNPSSPQGQLLPPHPHPPRLAPAAITDTPEDLVRRDNAAMAHVAALPVNADEASLAATYVAAGAQAMECLRLARQYPGDPNFILKCTAQAASLMRQARAARTLLLRVQAERRKLEADSATPLIAHAPSLCICARPWCQSSSLAAYPPAFTARAIVSCSGQ